MTDKCPSCEYNKLRAEMWREEAYRQAGRPLPEPRREWVGLTTDEMMALFPITNDVIEKRIGEFACAIEAKLREKNT